VMEFLYGEMGIRARLHPPLAESAPPA
jgi:hypothetical protein